MFWFLFSESFFDWFFILLIIIWKFYACICIILHLPFSNKVHVLLLPLKFIISASWIIIATHKKNPTQFCICFSNPQIFLYKSFFCYFFVRYLFCLQIVHKILKVIFTSDVFIWDCLDKQFLYYSFIPFVCSVMLMALNVVLQKRKLIFLFFITTKLAFLNYKNNLYYIHFRDSLSLFLFNVPLLRK